METACKYSSDACLSAVLPSWIFDSVNLGLGGVFLRDKLLSSVTFCLSCPAMRCSVGGVGAANLITNPLICVGRSSRCVLKTSVSSGSSTLAGPMPRSCNRVWVSAGKEDQVAPDILLGFGPFQCPPR